MSLTILHTYVSKGSIAYIEFSYNNKKTLLSKKCFEERYGMLEEFLD